MALIECTECGTTISSKAAACPICGAPPEATQKEKVIESVDLGNLARGNIGLTAEDRKLLKAIAENTKPKFAAERHLLAAVFWGFLLWLFLMFVGRV